MDHPSSTAEILGGAEHMVPNPATVLLPSAPARGLEHVGSGLEETVDVVIVGSGPGGGSVARVLAEAGLSVRVVEMGPKKSTFRPNYPNVARYHMQEAGTMLSQGHVSFPIAAGMGVGGSTLVNSALSFRAPRAVLDGWAAHLDEPRLGFDALQPAYDEVSELVGVGITREVVAGENNKLIVRGIEKLGLEGGFAPRSTPGCSGCGVCYFGCPTGGKASTDRTLLPRAVTAGAVIQAEVRVEEVLIENGRAVGIRGRTRSPETGELGASYTVRADHVVLSAGAVGTPRLLAQCGLTERLGPHVGQHLQIHPGSAILAECDHEVHLWKGATQGAWFHHPELPGVLPHTFSAPPEACLVAGGFVGERFQEGLALLPRLAGMLLMVSDKGEGSVGAWGDGRAKLSYTFALGDVDRIKKGLVAVAEVLQAGGAGRLHVPVHGVSPSDTPEELGEKLRDRDIRDFTLYAAHPMGTSRMGRDIEDGVVDARGQAHGLDGLWIADAGLFPTSLGVNPQLSTMVMGHWVARRMLDTLGA
jgi:choline dehydrogenase-like flavoprotein